MVKLCDSLEANSYITAYMLRTPNKLAGELVGQMPADQQGAPACCKDEAKGRQWQAFEDILVIV